MLQQKRMVDDVSACLAVGRPWTVRIFASSGGPEGCLEGLSFWSWNLYYHTDYYYFLATDISRSALVMARVWYSWRSLYR